MSSRPIKCAHCKQAIIAVTRSTGTHHPGEKVQAVMDPDQRNVVLLVCPLCNGVSTWKNKRILIVDC